MKRPTLTPARSAAISREFKPWLEQAKVRGQRDPIKCVVVATALTAPATSTRAT